EGGEAAAQPDHDEEAGIEARRPRAVGQRQRPEEPDHERAKDVDEERAVGKIVADAARHHAAEPVARYAAEGTAERHPAIRDELGRDHATITGKPSSAARRATRFPPG